jgi:colanic acid biosynthesis glycosyl transferase WcaI
MSAPPAFPHRVVFVNRFFHPDESATSRILSDLAFQLAARGVGIVVVTSRQLYDDPRASLPPEDLIRGVTVYRLNAGTRGRGNLVGRAWDYLSFHLAAGVRLLSILRRGDVVVAKTDPPLISIVVSYAARLRGAQLVNWLQDLFPEVATALRLPVLPGWVTRLLAALRDHSLRRASANIVLGERMRELLLARGIDAQRLHVVPNWADTQQIEPRCAAASETRQAAGLAGRFVVGYSGNLGRAHEFDTLLGAARRLKEDARFAFLMIGGGAKFQALRAAAHAEGLDNFRFLPYRPPESLADSLAAADIHLVSLLPELEGLIVPSKLYGILAAARPAIFIGDRDGEVARVLQREDCGFTVAVGDSERLAQELVLLATDSRRLQSWSENAHRAANAQYTTERAVGQWLSLLRSISPELLAQSGHAVQRCAESP